MAKVNNNSVAGEQINDEKASKGKKQEQPMRVPLSQRMRERTKTVHDKSDRLVNLKLTMVLTSKELYAEAISLFWPIYKELESILEEHRDHEKLGQLYPLLRFMKRSERFERDMESLLEKESVDSKELAFKLKARRTAAGDMEPNASEGQLKIVYSPAELQSYIDHMRHLSKENPIVLVAYISAMYGAIMAGGSIIKRMVKKAFALESNRGVEMFEFDFSGGDPESEQESASPANIQALRNEIKCVIDQGMQLTPEEEELILEESPNVFIRNNALVATVQHTAAFSNASKRIYKYIAMAAVIGPVIIGVLYASFFQG